MVEQDGAVGDAHEAVGRGAWAEAYRLLADRDRSALSAADLEALADAAWWLCRVEESLAVRQQAHAAHVVAGDARRAGYSAWMLSVEYGYVGKPAVSAGWLQRAQRHLRDEDACVEQGFVLFSEAEAAEACGSLDEALRLARAMTAHGRRCGSADVVALGMQTQGRLLVATGRTAEGVALLDEVMVDAVAGRLGDLVTGWVYCLAVAVCFDIADLRRAAEWNDAAMAWCASLPAGTPFHGLCRVHHVELLGLGGAWDSARDEARRACDELVAYHPNMAGEAFAVAGELHRRMGDAEAAEEAFVRAAELGRDPQPGLALLRLDEGRADMAAAALRAALAATAHPLGRARLLAAQVEVAMATGDVATAERAAAGIDELAEVTGQPLLAAMAATARGTVLLAAGDAPAAAQRLRAARGLWLDLAMPYEAATARLRLATASQEAGDRETARLEARAARQVFARAGSTAEVRRADELLGDEASLPARLTAREVEVLRLVAAGKTNRDIAAELVLSPHTVARHLNNIFTKLGVSSRSAATAFAFTHDLVAPRP